MFTGFTASNAESAPRDTPVAHQVDPWVAPWLKGTYPRSDQDVNKPYSTRSKKYGESQEKKPTFRMCGEAGLWKILPARYIKLKTGYFVFIDVSTKQSPLLSGINSCFLWEKILQKRTYPDSSASKANACSSSTKVSICVCKISCCINFNYQEKKLINHAKGKNCLVFRLLFW